MRGSAEYTTMKGFMDGFTVKGGEDPEILPNESGSDVALSEELQDKADGKEPPKGSKKTNEDDITFDKDVKMVEDEAKKDIADGYVSDAQGEKVSEGKGYKAFNEMVNKGYVVDVELNQATGFDEVMKSLREQGDLSLKSFDSDMVIKVALGSKEAKKAEAEIRRQIANRSNNPSGTYARNDPKAPYGGRGSQSGGTVLEEPPKPKPMGSGASVETIEAPKVASSMVTPNKDVTSLKDRAKFAYRSGKAKVGAGVDAFNKLSTGKKAAIAGGAALGAAGIGAGAYALSRKKDKGFDIEDDSLFEKKSK